MAIHQALADPTRIRVLRLVLERELCVCEIVGALEEPQYKVSRHLTVLKNAGLVRDRRAGTYMFYAVASDLSGELLTALQALAQVWDAIAEVERALWRVRNLCFLPDGKPCCSDEKPYCE
ncbi:MAG: ArsR/SmtB family transcription factor [Armatimonadota bacterium]